MARTLQHQQRGHFPGLGVLVCALCFSVTGGIAIAQPAPEKSPAGTAASAEEGMESKPLRVHATGYTLDREAENVERLRGLLSDYYRDLQDAQEVVPNETEASNLADSLKDAENLAKIPFSADKVRLNGSEGSTALSQITLRLADNRIPESRREVAPICSIRTHQQGVLVSSKRRSLRPVGKNHYVARIQLQAGDTSLFVQDQRWDIRLPQAMNSNEFLITLYRAPGSEPELHIFAIDDLLAEDNPHIPSWLPDDIQLPAKSG